MEIKKINEKGKKPKKSKEVKIAIGGIDIINLYHLDGDYEVQILNTEPLGIDPDFYEELKDAIKKFQREE